jgi:hypothetical protein
VHLGHHPEFDGGGEAWCSPSTGCSHSRTPARASTTPRAIPTTPTTRAPAN